MSMHFWIRKMFARPASRPIRKAERLNLEMLEDRWVPASFVVNNPTDTPVTGQLDLRQAITAANASAQSNTITFDATVFATPQTITLGGTQLEMSNTTGTQTIVGSVAGVTIDGGGTSTVLRIDSRVNAAISQLTFTGGSATSGGGVNNHGTLALTASTISGNTANFNGGGLYNAGTATLTNCTVAGNSAYIGGGVYDLYAATATLIGCTVSGNSAVQFGGFAGSTKTTVGNTIIAGNSASFAPDVIGDPKSLGNNLIGVILAGQSWIASDLTGTAAAPLNPVLAPLGNYGGPTQTMALLPGSPAVGDGNTNLIPVGTTTDQRGEPRVFNGILDIGAFESQGFTLTVVPGSSPQSAVIGTQFANPLAVTVTANNPIEPVDGGLIRFTAQPGGTGASAIFSASSVVIAGGQAAVTAAPNNIDGDYQVLASAGTTSTPFKLTNTGPTFTTLAVNTTVDAIAPGAGLLSLREALAFANSDTTGHAAITFDPTVFASSQTITLSLGQLELTNTTETESIVGPTAGVTIDGGGTNRVFQVDAGVTASITGLTITDGSAASGGGVLDNGTLTLTDAIISGNTSSQNGGGLYIGAGAHTTLTGSTVSGNYAYNYGGGVLISGTGLATLVNSTVSGNSAFVGGGLYNLSGGLVALTSSTVSGNSAFFGGGILNTGSITLSQSTVSNNTANYNGGGVYNTYYGTATLGNTIVAGNTSPAGPDVLGGFTSLGNNLIGDASGGRGFISSDLAGTGSAPINAVLAPLGNYGGPTETMPLLPGSPAIGAGSLTLVPSGATTDQRGEPRLLDGTVDIGAFESQGFVVTVVPGSTPQSAAIGTQFTNPLAVTVVANNPIEPVDGGLVSFVAHPAASGASAIFSSPTGIITGGQASVTAAPNNADGEYEVDAVIGQASVPFDLTNTGPAFASLTVNTTSDEFAPGAGLLSLREAVAFANSDTTGNATITFDTTVFATAQTIDLTGGQFELTNTTETETIIGPAAGLTLDAGGTSRVLQVDAGVTASLSGLTFTNGTAVTGGGITSDGTLTLTDCILSGNTASLSGGGLQIGYYTTATLTDCTISGNTATNYGGGIYVGYYANATFTNCTVSGNTSREGGGLMTSYGATATISSSTISGNTGGFGGGILNFGTLTLNQSTIANNTANYSGGGVYSLYNTTTNLGNTIVAGNTSSFGGTDLIGSVNSQGNNLVGNADDSTGLVSSDLTGTAAAPLDPLLAPLGDYGGPTETMPLLPGSPAIAAGNVSLIPGGATTDQRGEPRLLNGAVDIGAFESQGFTVTPDAGSTPQSAAIGTQFANPLSVTVTANNPIEPVDGGKVRFVSQPASNGAAVILSASSAVITGGHASVTAAPNNVNGESQVVVPGSTASFDLTNTGTPFTTLTVNTTVDSLAPGAGLLSLREAIEFANIDTTGNSTIHFDPTVFATAQTITLSLGGLELNNLTEVETIVGPAAGVTVDAGATTRVLQVDAGVTASISGMTLANGSSATYGGGVLNLGTLTLTNSTVTGNVAADNGGGIENLGTLTLVGSTVSDNTSGNLGGGIFDGANATTTLTNTTISGNSASLGGGVVDLYSLSDTMTDCTISGNTAGADAGIAIANSVVMLTGCTITGNAGGGVYNGGTLTLANTTISDNTGYRGAGLYNSVYGTATLTDCNVTGNTSAGGGGGGILNFGQLVVDTSTISGNSAIYGGGLYNLFGASATLTDSTISGNYAYGGGGGVFNFGPGATVTMTNCTVSGNSITNGGTYGGGGGVYNGYQATLAMTGCTISGNTAIGSGGGVSNANYSTATLLNTTIYGNTSTGTGGGVYNSVKYTPSGTTPTTLSLINCTVSGNSAEAGGGGVYNGAYGTTNIGNTIVAVNTAPTGTDAEGGFASQGNNLIGVTDGSTGWISTDLTGSSAQPLDPLLAPLGDYGGPTQTMALLPGSAAIDAGNNGLLPGGVTTDQRGLSRTVNTTVDIGAFESSGFTIAISSGDGQSTLNSTAFADPLVVTVTANNAEEPVEGGVITFTPPSSGASATLSGIPATIDASGNASVDATANDIGGTYSVDATATGITTPASFSLTNMWVTAFSNLTSASIVYGTITTTFTGTISTGTTLPAGATVSITLGSVTQSALIDDSGNFTTTFNTATLGVAGSPYTVTYVYAGDSTFAGSSDSSTTLTVTKANATVVVTPYDVTYDGTAHMATITTLLGVNGETGAIVGTVNLDTTHTDAGTYDTDSWSFTGSANYNDLDSTTITDVIGKANATVVITPYDVAYDGTAHTATITSITGVNGETGATVGAVTLDSTHTNAGTYATDSWSFTGTANYNDIGSTTIIDIIEKANATVVITPYTVTYDGVSHTATVTSITGANGETGDAVGTVTLDSTHTNAGTYTDSYSFAGTANYNDILSTSITDIINKADAIVVVTPYSVTYDGRSHSATVTSVTGVNGETGDTVGTVTLISTHTNAGTYTDSWTFAGTANYNDIASTDFTDVIAKADATVVVTPYSVTYDGKPHTATVTSITGINGETGATVGTVTLNTTHTNAGTYASDSWSFTGAGNYNDIASTAITDVIAKAAATVVVTPYSVTYNGTPHTATVTSITGVNGETGAAVGTVTLNTTHTNAGTYASDTWNFTGAGNYNDIASTTITDTIAKANATVVVTPYTVTYDGKPHIAAVTSITGVNGELGAVVGTVSLNTTHTSAGIYASDTWNFTGAGNYNDIAATTITDTINQATLTITANDATKVYGILKTFDPSAFTETGLVTASGDTIIGVTETSTGAPVTAVVASYSIVPSAATGTGLSNYNIVYVNGTLTVTPAATILGVSSSANPAVLQQTVTFTATVTPASGAVDNGGTVQFVIDGVNFGSPVTVTGGQATITDSALAVGSHTVAATYTGDTNLNGSNGTLTGGQSVTLASGQVSGTVFRDFNLDGQQDFGEPAVSNQTVFLDLNNSGAFVAGDPMAVTAADGTYNFTFTGLTPGTYAVRQMLLGGVLLSVPASGSNSVAAGVETSFTNLNFGDVLTSITVPLTLPPTTPFPSQGNATANYIEAVYRAVLNRNADPGGLTFWAGTLSGGSQTRLEVVQGIRNSKEHFTQEIDAFYHTLLGRQADPQGEEFWVEKLQSGVLEEQIAASFLNSPEYLSKGDKFFVDAMYNSLLGRDFDSVGEAFWLSQLGDDTSGNPVKPASLSHAQVVTDFLYSTESLVRLVQGYYTVFLQRQADTDGLNSWLNQLQQGLPFLTIGQQFVASDEFFNKAAANN